MALKRISFNSEDFDISYEIINKDAKKDLIILHGWGANKELMKNSFGSGLKDYRHIYIDLPGFGKSSNDYILDVYKYKNIINTFLKTINSSKDVIMGHSYGGKVATLLNPSILVLLSTAGIIEEKKLSIKVKIRLSKVLNIFGLKKITKLFRSKDVNTMSENMYETFKNAISEDLSEDFKNFNNKAFIFWGEKDSATSLSSGKKIASLIKNSEFTSYDGDHFFFLKYNNEIMKRLQNGIL